MSGRGMSELHGLSCELRSDQRVFVRNRGFELARAAIEEGADALQLPGCLQQVNKALAPAVAGRPA